MNYEKQRPTNLTADANSVIATEEQDANHSSLSKGKKTIDEIADALTTASVNLYAIILKKITKWVEKMWININYLYVWLIPIILFQINILWSIFDYSGKEAKETQDYVWI